MRRLAVLPIMLSMAAAPVPSSPELGKAEGLCRANETGPALMITADGLKDRRGTLKLEVYPPNDADFLQDDNTLVNSGKVFRRVEQQIPAAGPVTLCVRIPGPGVYSVTLLHDRDMNRKFGWTVDGIGFAGNPKLGWSKPHAAAARIAAGNGLTSGTITLNYRHGLGVAPIHPAGVSR